MCEDSVIVIKARTLEQEQPLAARQPMANTFHHLKLLACTLFLLLLSSDASPRKVLPIGKKGSSNETGICKQMVEVYGYICEEHSVTTRDGYILAIQRMPAARGGQAATKPPVLLQHGILTDAASWLFNNPTQSLSFILADNGYDVWLANSRGTKQSSGHTSLSPRDPRYWDWSWDELVKYDLAAVAQHVHYQTGQKLHYVGHSLGTLMALAALTNQEMLNMFRSAALLSPIAYLNQTQSSVLRAAAHIFLAEEVYWLGLYEFAPGQRAFSNFLDEICITPGINCSNLMNSLTGPNCCVNTTMTDAYFQHQREPTSTKNLIHLSQMVRSGTVAMYDYENESNNIKHYGQPSPPVYNMTSIPEDFPLFLGYGGRDLLADVKDVQALLHNLKDHERDKLECEYREDYAHSDFILGANANRLIYDPILHFFRRLD